MKQSMQKIERLVAIQLAALLALIWASAVRAEVRPNSLFADNAVLQRGKELPVWGTARDGERVTIEFAGQKVLTVAKDGKWQVRLKPMKVAVTPRTMTIIGENTVTLTNILVGDVWVASGQSNMERPLGPREGQKPIVNWQAEAAAADYPAIREYYVPEHLAYAPAVDANGRWRICSPQTVQDFSAVGYFFARDVYQAEKVPIGILFTAWGGTVAEAWTSADSLKSMADFKSDLEFVKQTASHPESTQSQFAERLARWYAENDPGSARDANWSAAELSLAGWTLTNLPRLFDDNFDGVIWFRKEIGLPASWAGEAAVLRLGAIDDADTTWVNGVQVGATDNWLAQRNYPVPAGVLTPGRNVIAIRALDTGGVGGFTGKPEQLKMEIVGEGQIAPIPLAGEWYSREGCSLTNTPPVPPKPDNNPNRATVLYNAMIAPLQSFPIKGVIWYQGESNNGRANQYQELFPLLISDWRLGWHCGEFPFLFVQIAPYRDMKPDLREAQFLTLKTSPHTAMAVITDAGDANDIHPAQKQVPGQRLALAARALAYGEKLEYSGPLFDSMRVEGDRAVISFTHTGGGLVAKDGALKGFVIAGADKNFVTAKAEIRGMKVVVWSDQVRVPMAVRYGWANVPDVNLFNKEGLPASPFGTDNDPSLP